MMGNPITDDGIMDNGLTITNNVLTIAAMSAKIGQEMSPKEAANAIMLREQQLRDEEEERRRKNSRFTMIFDDVGTSALQAVAERSGKAIQLFLWLGRHMDHQGAVCVSNEVLAQELNLAPNNIPRILRVLREEGVMWSMKSGPANVHCMNPEVAWRSSATGKEYALFKAAVIADAQEFRTAQAEARDRAMAAHRRMEARSTKNVRAVVLKPTHQPDLPPPVGPAPATEIPLEHAGTATPQKKPKLKIKRSTRKKTST